MRTRGYKAERQDVGQLMADLQRESMLGAQSVGGEVIEVAEQASLHLVCKGLINSWLRSA